MKIASLRLLPNELIKTPGAKRGETEEMVHLLALGTILSVRVRSIGQNKDTPSQELKRNKSPTYIVSSANIS